MSTSTIQLKCSMCIETMQGPIYQCDNGHTLCQQCLSQMSLPNKCPLCHMNTNDICNILLVNMVESEVQRRTGLTNVRHVEAPVSLGTSKIHCRFKSDGCNFVLEESKYDRHIEECLYRDMLCPFSAFNSSCFWVGKFNMLKNHFSTQHQGGILSNDTEYDTPDLSRSAGKVCLVVLDKVNFILHWRTDTVNNLHLIAVQNIGTKAYAHNWNYEIKFFQVAERRRCFAFTGICTSDSVDIREIFQKKHCIVIPNSVFNEFGTRLKFKVLLQKIDLSKSKSHIGTKDSSTGGSRGLALP